MELKGVEVSITDQSLLAYGMSYLARSGSVSKDVRRCWSALGAKRRQPSPAVNLVTCSVNVDSLASWWLWLIFSIWLTLFCCSPKQLVLGKNASKYLVR